MIALQFMLLEEERKQQADSDGEQLFNIMYTISQKTCHRVYVMNSSVII